MSSRIDPIRGELKKFEYLKDKHVKICKLKSPRRIRPKDNTVILLGIGTFLKNEDFGIKGSEIYILLLSHNVCVNKQRTYLSFQNFLEI